MVKQNKRKSEEGGAVASPKKFDGPKTPKNNAASPKKVKIDAQSPMQLKNKPMKTPVKHNTPKSFGAKNNLTQGKQKKFAKKASTNGAAKKSPLAKIIIPENLTESLSRRDKKRVFYKIKQALHKHGKTTVDPNDPSIKEIFEKVLLKDKSEKTKVVKQKVNKAEGNNASQKGPKNKTPMKKPVPKKTPKKSPKTN